ncbi:hypothetical protein G9A89_020020 [Geosiphon pyriformis]|nr:hypothetical protein G9A89_020020 [Geosiphon pyriformis]
MAYRHETYPTTPFVDPTPLPDHIPHIDEVGFSSAPLKSVAFFIGAFCKEYNEDFMLCKNENNDPTHCLKEGRKVTRCAIDLIRRIRENCDKELDAHWICLDRNNQEYFHCRPEEKPLNACVLNALNLEKTIPGTPKGQEPIHLKKNPIFKPRIYG